MKYKFQNSQRNLELLDETMRECNMVNLVSKTDDFTVCSECICFPAEQVGLKNALVSSCEQSFETCIICGD
jgi:hypothetical protein